jgi:hypothetical protein
VRGRNRLLPTGGVAIFVALLLLAGCSREPILPLCEGALYVRDANSLAAEAIIATSSGDASALDLKVKGAQANLAQADARIAEATSSAQADEWREDIQALGTAVGTTRGVLTALSRTPTPAADALREQLDGARAALADIGPAAGCADLADPTD